MSYQTSSKRSPPFCLLNGQKNTKGRKTQKAERRRPFGTGLVRHCPRGLFSPFFTFLRGVFFRPFRLSLGPTICPWVSEDVIFAELRKISNINSVLRTRPNFLCAGNVKLAFRLLSYFITNFWLFTVCKQQSQVIDLQSANVIHQVSCHLKDDCRLRTGSAEVSCPHFQRDFSVRIGLISLF